MNRILKGSLLSIVLSTFIIGCGGGSSTSTNPEQTNTGYFIDAAVGGIDYNTSSNISGTTDQYGRFKYVNGDSISFSIGNLELGNAIPKSDGLITPEEIAKGDEVAKIAILKVLQSIDSDNNTSNGITIPKEIVTELKKLSKKVNIRDLTDDEKLLKLNKKLSAKLDKNKDGHLDIDETQAKKHFENSLNQWENGEKPDQEKKVKEDNEDKNSNDKQKSNKNGIFTYNKLEWQDDGTIEGNRVTYENRNSYCQSLTLGGYTDWRLPTVDEFNELNSVKDKLDFSWNQDNYLYWTADEGTAVNKQYIRFYNLSNGRSGIWYVDLLKKYGYDWNIRCVRSLDKNTAKDKNKKADITTSTILSNIFQGRTSKTSTMRFKLFNTKSQTLYVFTESKKFRIGTSNSEITGQIEFIKETGEELKKGDIFLKLKSSYTQYQFKYLGTYKKYNSFVKVIQSNPSKEYITVMNPYYSLYDNFLFNELSNYDSMEDMYKKLFD